LFSLFGNIPWSQVLENTWNKYAPLALRTQSKVPDVVVVQLCPGHVWGQVSATLPDAWTLFKEMFVNAYIRGKYPIGLFVGLGLAYACYQYLMHRPSGVVCYQLVEEREHTPVDVPSRQYIKRGRNGELNLEEEEVQTLSDRRPGSYRAGPTTFEDWEAKVNIKRHDLQFSLDPFFTTSWTLVDERPVVYSKVLERDLLSEKVAPQDLLGNDAALSQRMNVYAMTSSHINASSIGFAFQNTIEVARIKLGQRMNSWSIQGPGSQGFRQPG